MVLDVIHLAHRRQTNLLASRSVRNGRAAEQGMALQWWQTGCAVWPGVQASTAGSAEMIGCFQERRRAGSAMQPEPSLNAGGVELARE